MAILVFLFIAKVVDKILSTTKTICIQNNKGLLAGLSIGLSDLIYLVVIKAVVVADGMVTTLITALAGAVGCWLTVQLNNHFSKDQLYINVLLCDNKDAIKQCAKYLRANNITCVVSDCYTKELDSKTLSLAAYAETKAQSSIISAYIKNNPNIFKRVVKK